MHTHEQKLGSTRIRFTALLTFAASIGLLTAVGELTLLTVKRFFLGQFIRFGANIIWLNPLANLILFSAVGLILFLIVVLWPRLITLRRAGFVLTFLASISLLLMYSRLHTYATLLLATGMATVASRIIATFPVGAFRVARYSLGSLLVLMTTFSLGSALWQTSVQRETLDNLPKAKPGAPNVLLIVLDTVRVQNLSLHGYSRPTSPQLSSLAKQGVRFDQAMSTASWTLPSHASMFTGRWPHELSADWFSPLNSTYPTIAETLRENGYETAGFVANKFYCGSETGLARGFTHYQDFNATPSELLLSSSLGRTIANSNVIRRAVGYHQVLSNKSAAELNQDFLHWLSKDRQRPFFAFLNYFDAHEVYLPEKPFDGMFDGARERNYRSVIYEQRRSLRKDWQEMTEAEVRSELNAYDETIAYLDHQLGLLFAELKKRNVLDNTLVILTSDHGEQFGEHRLFMHGNSLYSQLLHVPLLLMFPKQIPEGLTIQEPVSLRDLPATIVDLAGAESTYQFPGKSWARFWRETKAKDSQPDLMLAELTGGLFGKHWYPAFTGNMKSIRIGQYHYIANGNGTYELYDLSIDPLETNNLAESAHGQELASRFKVALEELVRSGQSEQISLQQP